MHRNTLVADVLIVNEDEIMHNISIFVSSVERESYTIVGVCVCVGM